MKNLASGPSELDLHGLRVSEALERFVKTHNTLVGKKEGFRVIHGYGSSGIGGQIRSAVRALLTQNPNSARWIRGEEMDLNPGCTLVYPLRRLPTGADRLWAAMCEYCATPRTRNQVISKFLRLAPESTINSSLRQLERRGSLRTFMKNGYRHYVSTQR